MGHNTLNTIFYDQFRSARTPGLSEDDILDLQDCFLVPGIHILSLTHVDLVRSAFASMAGFLSSSSNIACLTVIPGIERYRFFNLYKALHDLGATNGFSDGILEDYLLTAFNADVLYIEASPALTIQPWFLLLKYLLFKFKFVLFLPIVIVNC